MFQGVCWNFLRGQLGTAKLISEKKHIKVGESQKLATSDRVRVIRRSRQIFFGAPQLGFGLIKVIFYRLHYCTIGFIAIFHHHLPFGRIFLELFSKHLMEIQVNQALSPVVV